MRFVVSYTLVTESGRSHTYEHPDGIDAESISSVLDALSRKPLPESILGTSVTVVRVEVKQDGWSDPKRG